MPRLVAPNRRLGLAGRRLVTDAGGAPCCCGGCPQEIPECIEITLEVVDEYAPCQEGSFGSACITDKFDAASPRGTFLLKDELGNPSGIYEIRTPISGPTFWGRSCFQNDIAMYAFTEYIAATLACRADTDGVSRFGISTNGLGVYFNGDQACFGGGPASFRWGIGGTGAAGIEYTNETRPGSDVVAEGETGLTAPLSGVIPTSPGVLESREDVRYRFSWRAVNCGNPSAGACCLPGGTCLDLDSPTCAGFGGAFRGLGTTCADDGCPPPDPVGACCNPDGSCSEQTAADCASAGGTYQGDGIACGAVECPQPGDLRACCFDDGSCQDLSVADCTAAGGLSRPGGVLCVGFDCPGPTDVGACCLGTGDCIEGTTRAACGTLGGSFYEGLGCTKVPCIQTEAKPGQGPCCLPSGLCVYLSDFECRTRGGETIAECLGPRCDGDPPQQVTAGDFF